jgi:hypothetical protein
MFRIAWKVRSTGYAGNGDYCLTKDSAEAWITDLNEKYPEMDHWIEEEL